MDHKNIEEFEDHILVNFDNGRVVKFEKISDSVSKMVYLHPKGEYIDDNSECWVVVPLDVYLESQKEILHIRFIKN